MELTQDKLDLIEKIIRNDRKFSNNEDLYEDFFNETCRRSMAIIKAVNSDASLQAYIKKIATTSIINVLKASGRIKRSGSNYTPIHYPDISYDNFITEETPEEELIKKDTYKQILNLVLEADKEEPEKNYLQIYKLRYDKGLTQKEISEEVNLSQSEISKRLFKLTEKVKKSLNDMSDM